MTRTHHDRFAKRLLTGLPARLGKLESQREVGRPHIGCGASGRP
jgi:hypothetical protein